MRRPEPTDAFSAAQIAELIVAQLEKQLPREAKPVRRSVPFAELGLNSIEAVAMLAGLNRALSLTVPPTVLFDYSTVDTLAQHLEQQARGPSADATPLARGPRAASKGSVALLGMGVRLPGAESVEELWSLLEDGQSQSRPLPADRFPLHHARYHAALLPSVDRFEAPLFETRAHEAERMDPQQRLFLETAYQAVEDAGLDVKSLKGRKVGVFVGVSSTDYSLLRQGEANVFDSTGNAHSIVANRLSYLWDLQGPSIAIDTACSSSLVALHLAASSLRAGECELAIVGGVNLCLKPELFEIFERAGMLSPDGQCKTFSEGANGYVRGEGCGVLVLGLGEDGELHPRPYAFIAGSAVNQDGRTNGLTAPSGRRQQAVIQDALASAGLTSSDVQYVEAHGTGTALGDPVEYQALLATYGEGRTAENPLRVGSVKTLVGHLEAGAGVAGVMKAALMVSRRKWVASRNFTSLNGHIQDGGGQLKVQVQTESAAPGVLRVGVSSFGFGGTNAHVVVRGPGEHRAPLRLAAWETPSATVGDSLLLLGAPSAESLRALIESWGQTAQRLGESALRSVVEQTLHPRSLLPFRKSLVWKADSSNETLVRELQLLARNTGPVAVSAKPRKLAFLMTGQGAQSVGMGRGLYRRFPAFREALNGALTKLSVRLKMDLPALYFGTGPTTLGSVDQTLFAQPCLFAFEYALLQLLESLELRPALFIGHSLGEVVALVGSSVLSLDEGVELVCARAEAMERAPAGRMINVLATRAQVEPVLRKLPALSLAAENGTTMTVLSGAEATVARAAFELEALGHKVRYLKTERAFHSALMDGCVKQFEASIGALHFGAPHVPIISTLTGKQLDEGMLNAHTWADHIRRPTLFRAAVATAVEAGADLFLEIGPHPILTTLVKGDFPVDCLHLSERTDRQTGANGTDLTVTPFLRAVGGLFERNVPLKLSALSQQLPPLAERLSPPPTPMRGRRFWLDATLKPAAPAAAPPPPAPTLAAPMNVIPSPQPPAPSPSLAPRRDVSLEIRQLVAETLGMPIEELNLEIPLVEYGADSLVLVAFVEKIRDRFGVEVALADLLSTLPNLSSVIGYVEGQVGTTPVVHALAAAPSAPVTLPQMAVAAPQISTSPFTGAPAAASAPGLGVLGAFKTRASLSDERSAAEITADAARLEAYRVAMVEAFTQKTQGSKASAQSHRIPLADNRVSAGFRPKLKEVIYPLLAKSAKGAHFTDVDGNDYVDVTMGFGVNLFGHSPDFLEEPLRRQLQEGIAVGPQSPLAGPVAELFCELTGNDRVAFLNSGTEAVMTALRLARAATKRSKVVLFSGSYHGHFDGVLARTTEKGASVPVASGVPASLTQDVVVLEYGSPEALRYIQENAQNLAAVLVEPVQSRYPQLQPKVFLQTLRRVTAEHGCALIFDEVITGFRVGVRGAQGFFGVRADLATYGKILGGGFPIGAVAGSSRFLDFIDGGFWQFGDDSHPGSEMTFFAGTFCKHPLAMAAALETLKRLKASGPQELEALNRRTEGMVDRLNAFFEARGAPLELVRFASLFRFKFNGNLDWLFLQLNLKGVYVWEGRNMFLSTAHSDADVERIISTVQQVVEELIAVGYLAGKASTTGPGASPQAPQRQPQPSDVHEYPLHLAQQRFVKLQRRSELGRAAGRIGLSILLEGELHAQPFSTAVAMACDRHEILTACLRMDGGSERSVTGQRPVPRLQELGTGDTDTLHRWFETSDREDAALAIALMKEGPARHRLLLAADHVFVDGLSIAFLMDEIAKVYSATVEGRPVKLAPVYPLPTFLAALTAPRQLDKRSKAKAYWEAQLQTLQRQPVFGAPDASLKGGRVGLDLPKDDWTALKNLTFKTSCSLYTFLSLAVQSAVLETLGQAIGTAGVPVAGQLSLTDPMLFNCVGLMPVLLPAPAHNEGLARLRQVKETFHAGLKASAYGADDMLPALGRYPFDVVVNVEPVNELPKLRGLTASLHFAPQSASEFPLMLNAMKVDGTLRLEMDYQDAFVGSEEKARALLQRISEHARSIGTT